MNLGAFIIGCVTGFVSAFFGIGGSSIDTPLLRTFLNLPPFIALGTPLPLSLLTSVIGLSIYRNEKLINYRVAFYSLLTGVPGVMLGSYLTAYLSGKFLMLFTAIILNIIGINFMVKSVKERKMKEERPGPVLHMPHVATVAGFIGIISGILANGGGIFFVPVYAVFFRMKIKEAIATSLLTVAGMALPGSIIHYNLGHIDIETTALMGLGVIPMAYLGARLDIKTESRVIKMLFGLLLLVFSVYFFISQLGA